MIHTSRQLKALVRNRSGGDSTKAQIIIRNYIMERFLERLSLSRYRENLILKGGVLISSMVGLESRSTLDVDATIKNYPLTAESALRIVTEIAAVPLEDGITFQVKNASNIMDEADYSGIRVTLNAFLETMRTPLKLDLSTGDVITPHEVNYPLKLMFEERTISLLAYTLETVLAEKLECILSRGVTNTRMRDFYDLVILQTADIDKQIFARAFWNTCQKRASGDVVKEGFQTLAEVEHSAYMQNLWRDYQQKFSYAKAIEWSHAVESARSLFTQV